MYFKSTFKVVHLKLILSYMSIHLNNSGNRKDPTVKQSPKENPDGIGNLYIIDAATHKVPDTP